MKTLSEIMNQALELQSSIQELLQDSTYQEDSNLSGLDINYCDSEQLFQLEALRSIMENLDRVEQTLRYVSLPIQSGGQIWKNADGKYGTADGHVLSAGSTVDVLVTSGIYNVPYWDMDRIEHDGKGYYLVKHLNDTLDGLTIRIRGEE